jgi:hypothetical protein
LRLKGRRGRRNHPLHCFLEYVELELVSRYPGYFDEIVSLRTVSIFFFVFGII